MNEDGNIIQIMIISLTFNQVTKLFNYNMNFIHL